MQRKFTAEFKAQVALAAIGNQMTVTEIVEKFGVSKSMMYQWKNEFMERASKVFEGDRKAQQDAKQIDNLHRKIGELEMELDFAKRAARSPRLWMPALQNPVCL